MIVNPNLQIVRTEVLVSMVSTVLLAFVQYFIVDHFAMSIIFYRLLRFSKKHLRLITKKEVLPLLYLQSHRHCQKLIHHRQ